VEFRDLKTQYKKNKRSINKAIMKVLKSGEFIGGSPVKELEEKLAEYVGTKYCITCANGTDALTLVLMAWGIGPGDAVFVPDFTFFATAEAPAFLGATPVFVDVDEDTFNMCPDSLENAIIAVKKENKLRLKVIIPVDLFGLPADYDRILPIAKKYKLLVLEDAAQGFGGNIRGKMAGSFGDAAITSFFPAKPLGCYGDGGAIFTNDINFKELIESLKVHGKGNDKYDNIRIGMNSRLDTIQAAILIKKLEIFGNELILINKIAERYKSFIKTSFFKHPQIPNNHFSSFAQYTLKTDNVDLVKNLKFAFNHNNIPFQIYYSKILSNQLAFEYSDYKFSTKDLSGLVISIPIHPFLSTREIKRISNIINIVGGVQ
jgi:dTDP-4-amino-4,6-dideoxygalactose transaminase